MNGLFNMRSPEAVQQQFLTDRLLGPTQIAQMPLLNQVTAMGVNPGVLLGTGIGRLFGGRTAEEAESMARRDLLTGIDVSDPAALREAALNTTDLQFKLFLADRASAIEKQQADIARMERGGVGTGPERMASFVANVQSRLAAGEDVPQEERLRAQNFANVLARSQFFQLKNGDIVEVDKNDFGRQAEALRAGAEGAVEIPALEAGMRQLEGAQPAPSVSAPPAPAGRGTARTIPTTLSQEMQEAKERGREVVVTAAQTVFEDANRALGVLDQYGSRAAGWGSLASFVPESAAMELSGHIDSMKSNIGVDQLLKIKQSGAGLGQVPQSQLEMLASMLGNLNTRQSPRVLEQNITRIMEIYQDIVEKEGGDPIAKAEERGFTVQRRGDASQAAPASPAPSRTSPEDSALVDRIMADPRTRGTRAQVEEALRQRGTIK